MSPTGESTNSLERQISGELERQISGETEHSISISPNAIGQAVTALVIALDIQTPAQPVGQEVRLTDSEDPLEPLIAAAEGADIYLRRTSYRSAGDSFAIVRQGYAAVFVLGGGELLVLERPDGRKIEASRIGERTERTSISKSELIDLLGDSESVVMLVAKKELECETLSGSRKSTDWDHHHDHPGPVKRFVALLNLERRDIGLVILFASVGGILALATPLVVEGLVNVVSWGTYVQPLVVLAGMLLTCLGIAGVLKVLQTWVVEMIQRRQFVRIVSDLAHRFPRANQASLVGTYPRELANRVFDIMTIQKATAVLLLDGVSVVLTTILGLFLLAFYHPFLLGFDLVLILTMVSFIRVLGRSGIETAIEESLTKYEVAHWLQDVISMPAAFKAGGGERLAILRANQLSIEYIKARKKQFGVVIRQVIFAVGLQVVASTALLGLGGWLVINGQLTLGQLVASELVVTVVVGAFAKAGKSLEKFYDLMAGIDKVGHLLDIHPDARTVVGQVPDGPAEVSWSDITFHSLVGTVRIAASAVPSGARVAIVGDHQAGKDCFAKSIAGLINPNTGIIQVAGYDSFEAVTAVPGEIVGYAGRPEIFHGTIAENVSLGREEVPPNKIRHALTQCGLIETVLELPDGINTKLQTGGYPLTIEQQERLMIARAIASNPRVLVINELLDGLGRDQRDRLWQNLVGDDAPWTLIVITNRDEISALCDIRIFIRG